MNRITRLKIENFRRIKSLDLEMRPLGVMIGANGSGKSSILDALSGMELEVGYPSDSNGIKTLISKLGGVSSITTLDGSDTMTIGVEVSTDLDIEGNNFIETDDTIKHYCEILFLNDGSPAGRLGPSYYRSKRGQEVIFEFGRKHHTASSGDFDKLRKAFFNAFFVNSFNPQPTKRFRSLNLEYPKPRQVPIRQPQQIVPELFPTQDGDNLLSVLYNLREQEPGAFEEIIDTLRIAFPGFESLSLPTVAAGMVTLIWNDKNFQRGLYQNQLSEGMLRMLWLTSILRNPHVPPLTMIDEPEVSLHPELLMILAGCMKKATAKTQLLVATHSTSLIRNLNPGEVLVLDVDEDGMTAARWGDDDELNLESWLEDYSLDDVWHMGVLGGRAS